MEPKKFSYLRNIRKKFGMTAKELGQVLGVCRFTITAIEYGRIQCGELNARRFGEFFKERWQNFLSEKY